MDGEGEMGWWSSIGGYDSHSETEQEDFFFGDRHLMTSSKTLIQLKMTRRSTLTGVIYQEERHHAGWPCSLFHVIQPHPESSILLPHHPLQLLTTPLFSISTPS